MQGLRAIVAFAVFEVRLRLKQPGVYLFALVFALLGFGALASDAVRIGGAGGQTAINAPYVIAQFLGVFSVIGVLIVTAFAAGAVVRDFDDGAYQLFYTKPIHRRDYLLGRFFGGLAISMVVLAGAALGMAIGSMMPWLEADRLAPFSIATYVQPLIVFVFPSLFAMGAVFFAVATLTRRMLWAYVSVAGFFVLYIVSEALFADLDNQTIAALSDPFGLSAMALATRYWTPAERNTELLEITGTFAINRAIWISFGAAVLAATVSRFKLQAPKLRAKRGASEELTSNRDIVVPKVTLARGPSLSLQQLWVQSKVEFRGVLTSTAYLVLLLFAALNVYGNAVGSTSSMFGTPVYPVTHLMVNVIEGGMGLFCLIVITFYAGELVWRERKVGLTEVVDAMPTPNWIPLAAKTAALLSAVGLLMVTAMGTSIIIQLTGGFSQIEFDLYAKGLFGVQLTNWALICVLAIFCQVVANHKYLGFGLVVLFFIGNQVLPMLDFEHRLYRYASAPSPAYSDMNQYGHFVDGMVWFRLYWICAALCMLLIANLFWLRGTDNRLRLRIIEARRRVTKLNTGLLALAVATFASLGTFIYYNTNVVNEYTTGEEEIDLQVEYERKYKQYEHLPQPRIVATELEVDLFPESRIVRTRGDITLRNKTDEPIDTLHVRIDPETKFSELSLDSYTKELDDDVVGYRIYRLDPPLQPAGELVVTFASEYQEAGFRLSGSATDVVHNGTFIHNGRFLPHFGYDTGGELANPDERLEHDLPPKVRMPKLGDEAARANTYISSEADWIDFKATVSTTADQIALAPGYLVKEWTEGDRRYFRYEMDSPILNLYGFLSARYTVARDAWNDVAIEVYYHDPHDFNVPRMIEAVQKSLDYFTVAFSPYQHRQVRILEFPRYASYAQSLPNTIPYSESIGFIADLRDDADIDYVFYVTAHEVAHQWWAHQVIGANMQGGTLMSETLAQYSALMVMEREYGRDKMEKFLRHELDRYLLGRAQERHEELPLIKVENQPYIHYNKGSLVMYALREYIGEDQLNAALAGYIKDVGFQEAPYTTSTEFVDALREVTPPKYAYLIEDMFETITVYDNRMQSATAKPVGDGKYEVELELLATKFRADETGAETEIPIADWLEVGVFAEPDDNGDRVVLYREKHQITEHETKLTITVEGVPAEAGIDPMVLFVDRDPDDNTRSVELSE